MAGGLFIVRFMTTTMSLRKIQFVAVVLAIYGFYNVWMAFKYTQPLFLLWVAGCFLASAGLCLRKPWSRFAVYTVCSLTIFGLLSYIVAMSLNQWPYPSLAKTIVALIPGALLIAVCIWFMAVTFRFFHAVKEQA